MATPVLVIVGDVVQLPSGGPKMTVAVVGPKSIVVFWFNEGNELQSTNFPPGCLVKFETTPAPSVP